MIISFTKWSEQMSNFAGGSSHWPENFKTNPLLPVVYVIPSVGEKVP